MSFPTIPAYISSDQYRASDQLKPLFQHLIDNGWTADQIDAAINDKKFRLRMHTPNSIFEVSVSPRSIYVAFDWVKSILADMPQTTETPSFDDDAEVIDIATRKPVTRTATATAPAPLATSKQVALIMRLVSQGKHQEGGYVSGPTTAEGARAMTRRGASQYIDSLLGNY